MTDRLKPLVAPLASLKLTVALFAAAMVLIFAGTLAQRDAGNWQVVNEYFRSFFVLIPFRHLVFRDVPGVLPFPGGFTVCGLLLVNLLAVYLNPTKWKPRRAGILLLHAGLILLIVGELVTAVFADEGMMNLTEGSHASFAQDLREVELAVTQPMGDGRERVVVVPQSVLERHAGGEPIRDERLPFDVTVQTWMPNAGLVGGPMAAQFGIQADQNPADAGFGRSVFAVPTRPVSGVEQQQANQPAAYVALTDKATGEGLGTYLVTTSFGSLTMFPEAKQEVAIGETTWQVALRFRRTYLPYTLHLIDATHETFVGTDIPRNFSSLVRLVDPEAGEDREVLIYMNNPLRYRGQTFYQAQMGRAQDATGAEFSGLQVVTNPGWLIPYVSCAMVSLGMTVHFGVMLWQFVGRRERALRPTSPASRAAAEATGRGRWALPAAVAALAIVYLGSQLRPEGPREAFDLGTFAALPVTSDGRVKPMDTVARAKLLMISGRQSHAEEGERVPAIRWLLDAVTAPQASHAQAVFRVDHPDVKRLIGVGPGEQDRKRFTFDEIIRHQEKIAEQAELAENRRSQDRNPYQRHLLELVSHLNAYGQLQQLVTPHMVPPMQAGQHWQPLAEAVSVGHAGQPMRPAAAMLADTLRAYQAKDATKFNTLVREYDRLVRDLLPSEARKARFEVIFNRFAPFYHGTVLYVITGLLGFGSLLLAAGESRVWSRRLFVAAVTLLGVTFVLHTFGIAARVYLEGRPPVTNLYSSAVFIGWVAVGVAIFIERLFRNGVSTIIASAIGSATLIIAHNLADGDTMQVMQAVLDSNFWLATHVITVTIGYAAVFLAGAFGIAYIVSGVYTRALTPERARSMTKMIYGTVAFALLFSFVGTVLGGIWADQSWGRFWGWDPKENGAVLIVLITAMILHARWGGMIGPRGVAVLAVAGNIVTAWSWFGTNMLSVGLHSYGFMDSAAWWLTGFVISQAAIIAVGLIPLHRWASFERSQAAPATGGRSAKPVTTA